MKSCVYDLYTKRHSDINIKRYYKKYWEKREPEYVNAIKNIVLPDTCEFDNNPEWFELAMKIDYIPPRKVFGFNILGINHDFNSLV